MRREETFYLLAFVFAGFLDANSQNNMNQRLRSDNQSGYKGVYKRRNKWTASLRINGELMRVGGKDFDTPEEAHLARCAAAQEHYREFTRVA